MPATRLVILLNSTATTQAALVPLRYAVTAAALDMAVELHAVSAAAVALLARSLSPSQEQDGAGADWQAALRQAIELDVEIFVCPVALAERGLDAGELCDAVAGVRGAPSLLAAGMAPGARFMVF